MRPGWHQTKLGRIATILRGVTYQKSESSKVQVDGLVPLLRANNIAGQIVLDELVFVPPYRVKGEQYVRRGDIVVAMSSGSSALVGKAAEARCDLGMGFGAFCGLVRVNPNLARSYIGYFLQSDEYRRHIANQANGININNLRPSDLEDVDIWLAPFGEQERIVAKIEELFSQLDAGVANLKQAQALIVRYRQSLLKAAVSGELTAAWRERQAGGESGAALLARILKERRRRGEESHPNRRYTEPAAPDTAGLPELPEGWVWATVEQVTEFAQYGTSAKCNTDDSGVAVLRMGNLQGGTLDLGNLKYLPSDHDEFPELLLRNGDVLFNRTNSAELVGKTAVYRGIPETCSFASYLIRVRCLSGCEPDILAYFINSHFGRLWVRSVASQQVGQANVNGSKLLALRIPLPPLAEQAAIVEAIETAFSDLDAVEAAVAAELARAGRQRQAILAAAFAGKLVPQDPADEPAEKLLERLRKDKAEPPARTRRRAA